MSEFRKITQDDQREWLSDEAAADLAREMLEALGRDRAEAAQAEGLAHGGLLLHVNEERQRLYPEHALIALIWAGALVAGLWRLLS